jgi:Mrp family chromosome partitioning ATPase
MSSLTSERMKRVVAEAADRYDWVIIDTPPLALLPDANLLADMVDAAVLVIGAGRTPYAVIQKAVEAVGKDRIIGVVLNRVEDRDLIGGDYKTTGYYYTRDTAAPAAKETHA